ncbi:MerR family transcriptional regulator [Nocardia caishijiensis]|uniref:DNA-binding transcriptional MerR regulator n=1 Tax=Nocardia caishijiensis TaxID=184756 RepID=A0ABQ6YMY2_9NOCA|nr:MerR family transcriptional regulator [Nocardia caishijiensis]KAF0847133.1 DNA-binding transcriptional MerR regulator [Nocardia caishijiensis]
MTDTELITIGAFARVCGLNASALRFYADAGVLVPALVDEDTGYRYYTPDQAAPACLIRHLRAVDMPLPAVAAVLAEPDPTRATRLLDAHLTEIRRRRAEFDAAAAAAHRALGGYVRPLPDRTERGPELSPLDSAEETVRIGGPVLAAAIDQVLTATLADSALPVLDTVLFEAGAEGLTLTATDRYRLASRTLRPITATTAWTATIDATALRSTTSWLRRRHTVVLRPTPDHLEFACATADPDASVPQRCRRSAEDFPNYRAMLAALPPTRSRVVLPRRHFLEAMERAAAPTLTLHLSSPDTLTVSVPGRDAAPDQSITDNQTTVDAAVTGESMTVHFALTTLYPAVAGAIGPDIMLDLSAPDLPARIRSADDGDLLTLAMPCEAAPA